MSGWIEDGAVKPKGCVLVLFGQGKYRSMVMASWEDSDEYWYDYADGEEVHNVTHWQPLPEMPK